MKDDEQSMLDSALDKAPGFEGRAAGSLGNPTPTASSPAHWPGDLIALVANESSAWDSYLRWRDAQSCSGCGLRFMDRPKDTEGRAVDLWATETECWGCFMKRCEAKQRTLACDGTSLYASYSPVLDAPETNVMARREVSVSKPTQGSVPGEIVAPRPVSGRLQPRPDEIGYV